MDYNALTLREISHAVMVVAPHGEVLHWNPAAEAIFGFSSQEARSSLFSDLVVPANSRTIDGGLVARILAQGEIALQSVCRRRDDTLVYVDISGQAIDGSEHQGPLALLTMKDITQLRILHDTKLVEARFQDVLESTPDGIVMVNLTGHIVFANSYAQTMFGYGPEQLRGKPVELLLPERFHAAHMGHRATYLAQPRSRAMGAGLELFGLRKDGREFPVEISLSPLRMDETTLVMSAIRDITDRKRFEQTLRDKNLELERASRAKDRFLATMSHELRTPLNAVIGFTGTLLMKIPGPLTAAQDRQLHTIQASARHLLSLINDLLDLAKIEAGKLELTHEEVDCHSVIEEVSASMRLLAEKKGLQFLTEAPTEALVLRTNRRALSQILINLTANAVKYTERGSVRLSVRRRIAGADGFVAFDVIDTGIGVRPEDEGRLFEAFSRLDATTASGGSGLGLHLSRKLAQLLKGTIGFQSDYGKGSTFTLEVSEE